jgi:hypothetical protein
LPVWRPFIIAIIHQIPVSEILTLTFTPHETSSFQGNNWKEKGRELALITLGWLIRFRPFHLAVPK